MRSRAVLVLGVVAACGGGKKAGELGSDCYPNGTCNVTLACVGGLCVAAAVDAAVHDSPIDGVVDSSAGQLDAAIDATIDARPDAPPDANCEVVQTTNLSDGHHNAGQTCLAAGCHLIGNAGAGAPEYSFAGTLYHDVNGLMPFGGATIEVSVNSQVHKLVTALNGNFFIPSALASPPTAAAPGTALASGCPNTSAMAGQLVDNGGNCNNCHRSGGTTAPVYLP